MTPEGSVELLERHLPILFFQSLHLIKQVRMAANGTLSEDDEVARQDIRAFDGDADRNGAVEIAEIVRRSVDHRLARMNVHRIVHRLPHTIRRLRLHDGGDDGKLAAAVQPGAGEPPRGIEEIGGARDVSQPRLHAFELPDRQVELLAHARVSAGSPRREAAAAAESEGSEMPRPAASALISIFQPWPACSLPPITWSRGMKTSWPSTGPFWNIWKEGRWPPDRGMPGRFVGTSATVMP